MVSNEEKTCLGLIKNLYTTIKKIMTNDTNSKSMLSIPKSYRIYVAISHFYP